MNPDSRPGRQRGSVLIAALLLSAVIALGLGTYLQLSVNSMRLANRTFYANAAMNLAETGVEEAIWCFNQTTAGSTTAWSTTPWTTSGNSARATFTGFQFDANTTGSVKVYVDYYQPVGNIQPIVVAQATITLPNGQGTAQKYLEVKLRRRSLFATGLVAKEFVEFDGNNASVDSWNSAKNDDGTLRASPVNWSESVKHDHGSVGTVQVTSTVDVNNADIWGTAAVGGSSTSAIDVGPNGRVGPFGTPAHVKDPNSIATDFTANFDAQTTPTGGTVLPSLGSTLGTDGATTMWRAPNINDDLVIHGHVTLILTAPAGSAAISFSGTDGLTLAPGASLTVYTAGNVDLTGKGVLNPNSQPISLQIYGTSTSGVPQVIKVAGNGDLKAVVFAPNANISIHGNGNVMGSMVGKTITVTGNAQFHYDESLADYGGSNPFGVVRWRELTLAADRTSGVAANLGTF